MTRPNPEVAMRPSFLLTWDFDVAYAGEAAEGLAGFGRHLSAITGSTIHPEPSHVWGALSIDGHNFTAEWRDQVTRPARSLWFAAQGSVRQLQNVLRRDAEYISHRDEPPSGHQRLRREHAEQWIATHRHLPQQVIDAADRIGADLAAAALNPGLDPWATLVARNDITTRLAPHPAFRAVGVLEDLASQGGPLAAVSASRWGELLIASLTADDTPAEPTPRSLFTRHLPPHGRVIHAALNAAAAGHNDQRRQAAAKATLEFPDAAEHATALAHAVDMRVRHLEENYIDI